MARIMIISASTGEGHNQAASTLEKALTKNGHTVERIDLFGNANPLIESIMNEGYRLLVTLFPALYGLSYRLLDAPWFPWYIGHVIHAETGRQLWATIRHSKPDLIFSTHPFAAPIIGPYKKDGRVTQPVIQVVTDFEAHYTYIHKSIEAYIVAGTRTARNMVRRGIPASKVFPYGIPVREEFNQLAGAAPIDPPSKGKTEVLVMGGSMGLAPMETAVRNLARHPLGLKLTVVCGSNKNLKKRLDRHFAAEISGGAIEVLGFTREIPQLMQKSHMIITKPGGLTSSEAITIGRPLLITFAIPGQETDNKNYMIDEGMAFSINTAKQMDDTLNLLVEKPSVYTRVGIRMKAFREKHSLGAIIELAEKFLRRAS